VFATPGHPQASGLVERFNRTRKDVLLRGMQRRGRRWSRVVPSARDVSAGLSKSVEAWMTDLRDRLKKTADWAGHGQDVNKHSDESDQVIVLDDDAADKLCKRWQGPATVVRIKSPYSYLIDMGDGRVRHVHANMMCNLHAHVQSCDIISASDVYFSRVLVPATVGSDVLPSMDVDRSGIERLDPEQQGGLLALLGEFAACVSEETVLCRVCGVWLLFASLVCEMVKLPWLFGTVVVLFWKLVSILCSLLCAIVCEFILRDLVFRLCVCCLRLFGPVSSLLCGIEVRP